MPADVPAVHAQEGALDVWRLELPGRLESNAVHCTAGDRGLDESASARCDLFLIVRSHADHSLYRLSLQGQTSLARLAWLPELDEDKRRDLSPAEPRLEVLEVEGRASLFIAWMGRGFLHRFHESAAVEAPRALRQIVQLEEGGEWRTRSVFDRRLAVLMATEVGRLDVFWIEGDDVFEQSYRLPVQVERQSRGLQLRSPLVRRLPTKPPVLAVGPEEHGHIRLRTVLLDPLSRRRQDPAAEGTPSAAVESEENVRWSMLPGIEQVIASQYWVVEGRRVLAVVTLRADKMGVLERKKLRLFGLDSDRTRAGSRPFFAAISASRMWQRLSVDLVEAAGGSHDLVLVQPEGLGGGKLAIDLYRGKEGLRLEPKPIRSIVRVPESWWKYGEDWNGDGVADLLSLSAGVLRLFPGLVITKKNFLGDPTWEHKVLAPERQSNPPRRRATYEQGILVVRSRYLEGPDRLEVVTPRGGVKNLVVASLSSDELWMEGSGHPP